MVSSRPSGRSSDERQPFRHGIGPHRRRHRPQAHAPSLPPSELGRAGHLRAVHPGRPGPAGARGRGRHHGACRQPCRHPAGRRPPRDAGGPAGARTGARHAPLREALAGEPGGRPQHRHRAGHLHDEVLAQGQRPAGPEPQAGRCPPGPGRVHRPGILEIMWRLEQALKEISRRTGSPCTPPRARRRSGPTCR